MKRKPTNKKYKILISNDDSVYADGIKILKNCLEEYGHQVITVAPSEEMSTTGHFITLHKPLRVYKLEKNVYAVTGGPSDCVNIALNNLLPWKPDFVISGINRGANLGQDIFYSGTVSAAREACLSGIPGIAVSLALGQKKSKVHNYSAAAKYIAELLKIIRKEDFPNLSYLNINVPNLPYNKIKGIEVASQGFQIYSKEVVQRVDMRKNTYYWIGGVYKGYKDIEHSDCVVVFKKKKISLTMHRVETACEEGQNILRELFQK